MPSPTPVNVTVNFNVNIDASGNIVVFGTPAPEYSNTIVPLTTTLPVNALYDASGIEGAGGLIEFWEPSDALGDIKVQLADTAELGVVGAYQTAAKVLAKGLQRILVDDFDCSDATPFSGYTGTQQYYTYSDFGRVALSAHAHDLFGHVAATAAITNDQAFMSAMLSVDSSTTADGQTPQQRYATWSKSSMVDASDVQQWDASQTREDANLAVALAKAIVSKGLSGGVPSISSLNAITNFETDDTLANIVRQVIGQDASRAMDEDNNELAPDMHQFLRFYVGDKVVVSITLKEPALSMSVANTGRPLSDFNNAGDDSRKFNIVITLGPKKTAAQIAA